MSKQNNKKELTEKLIEGGAEIAGSVTGAAIGLIGGPVAALGGAALGTAIGKTLCQIGSDLQSRLLGPMEQMRVGATLAFATNQIANKTSMGMKPRDDGFFETKNSKKSQAEKLLEGVLLKSRDAYEEKKIPLLGSLYANLVFHPEISYVYAGYLIKLAGDLTYNQLVALAVARDNSKKYLLRNKDYRGDGAAVEALGLDGQGLLTEIYYLYQNGLISGDGSAWLSVPDVNPSFGVQGAGGVLASLMQLDTQISNEDRKIFYSTFHP